MNGAGIRTARRLDRLWRLARLLDDVVRIPLINRRIGLDGIVGLVPGLGDGATALLSLYIVVEAGRLGVPPAKLVRMLGNVALDAALGAVPVLGDVFDIVWKANLRNVEIIEEHVLAAPAKGSER